ncbi:thiol reductase thioredoxin [Desulfolithobacter dissulfuricans]|uniref:Thiol reductase thioredoxin n=2 Tax=Desulfolithobacter dissulfuricans TaxID=2795293 RepID=A0A915U0L3_9BACT|nr:thiol reductase thioredoxin [Desulfolithobacter dissulfuricans]
MVALTGTAVAEEKKFYDDSKRGWFWYEDPPPEEEPEKPEEKPARPVPSLQAYTTEELWNMHPDDFQELLMALQKKAVQYPTEENVLEYLTIQDIARRKAAAYANVAAYVVQKHGQFDVAQAYPAAMPGVKARVRQQRQEIASVITNAKDDHALLFFTNPDCGYCAEQRQILAYFTERYGWQIKTIDTTIDPGIAARFNISITPTLMLIRRDRPDYLTVTTGVVSLADLERRLYRAIRLLRGDITPENYSTYDFQKGGALDPTAILNERNDQWIKLKD